MSRLLPTLAPPRPWYKLPRWGWVVLLVVALGLTVANGWPYDELPVEASGNPRGPALAVSGFPRPAVLLILEKEGLHGGGEQTVKLRILRPDFTWAGDLQLRPGAAEPVTFADGGTSRVYDAWALALNIGLGVAALAAVFALCAWLARRAARRR